MPSKPALIMFFVEDGNKGLDSFIASLLQKCASEKNNDLRLMLALCLGEIGAIAPTYLDNDDILDNNSGTNSSRKWILEKGVPWKSKSVRIHYELQLVTNYFVTALKAAPTPTDQHKIGFAIQERKYILLWNLILNAHSSTKFANL